MTTRYKGSYGKMTRHLLQLDQGYAQITGNTAERDVSGRHVFSPCRMVVEQARAYAVVEAAGSHVIKLYAGSSKSGTLVGTVTLTPTITNALMTLNNPGKIWPADQEFCLSENGLAKDLDWLDVTMTCRELKG